MAFSERIRNSGLTNRLTEYDDELALLEDSINQKRGILNTQLADSKTPQKVSLQDALIHAAVSLTPALLGYAAAGKEGAYHGLRGGAVGGDIYSKNLEADYKQEREEDALRAQVTKGEIDDLVRQQYRVSASGDSLQNKILINESLEEGKDRRSRQSQLNLYRLMHGEPLPVGEANTSEGEVVPDATSETSATTSSKPTSENQEYSQALREMLNTEQGQKFAQIAPKEIKQQFGIAKDSEDIETKNLDQAAKRHELTELERQEAGREVIKDFGVVKMRPKDIATRENVEAMNAMYKPYKDIFKSFADIEELVTQYDGFTRSGLGGKKAKDIKSDLQSNYKEQLAKTYNALMEKRDSNLGRSVYSAEDAKKWVVNFGSAWSELMGWLGNLPFSSGTPLQSQFNSKVKQIKSLLKTDMEALNYEVVDDTEANEATGYVVKGDDGNLYNITD